MIEKLECTCIEAYTTRKMRDPNCCACSCAHNDLVGQLAKANERVALLERVERVFNESPELTFDNVKDMFSDELNKFAIEQQIKALNWCLSRCNHSFDSWADVGMYDSGISNTEIKDHIEQLRKEQENV